MDPQLKERLIGAAVLVALGVWLIPLVLNGPDVPLEEESPLSLQLPLPEDDSAMRRQTVELGGRDEAVAPTERSGLEAPQTAEEVSDQPSEPVVKTPQPAPAVEAVSPEQLSKLASAAAISGDWMVQLGSFGDRENAERLAKRVAAFGPAPEVSTFRAGGRVMYRVRIGPHASRDLAEAAASSLSAHGFVAQVVSID